MGEDQTTSQAPGGDPGGDEQQHPIQMLLDNHFLLLFMAVAIPAALYTIWGVMEVAQIPILPTE